MKDVEPARKPKSMRRGPGPVRLELGLGPPLSDQQKAEAFLRALSAPHPVGLVL